MNPVRRLVSKGVYRLAEDFYSEDFDGNDNYGIMYHKGELIFVYEISYHRHNDPKEVVDCATIVSKGITINWGPGGLKILTPCLCDEPEFVVCTPDTEAKLLLIMNGNKSIFDGKLRLN